MTDNDKAGEATNTGEEIQPERRVFLKQAAAAAALVAGSGASASAMSQILGGDNTVGLSTPLKSRRVIKSEHKADGNQQEGTVELELIDRNNLKLHSSSYIKRVDDGDRYDLTIMSAKHFFRSPSDKSPFKSSTSTMVMSGKKGTVEGEYRTDEVVITVISDGQVVSRDPVQMKVLVSDRFKGMSASELADYALEKRFGKPEGGNQ